MSTRKNAKTPEDTNTAPAGTMCAWCARWNGRVRRAICLRRGGTPLCWAHCHLSGRYASESMAEELECPERDPDGYGFDH